MTLTQADGATTIDPHWPGPFFETPTSLPPEASRSSHSRRFAAHARRRDLRILRANQDRGPHNDGEIARLGPRHARERTATFLPNGRSDNVRRQWCGGSLALARVTTLVVPGG